MRIVVLPLSVALLLASSGCKKDPGPAAQKATAAVQTPRMVILGFDGVDPRRVEALVQAGRLPHVAKLGAQGHRGPLATTNPPQSPVAWAAFATGARPGDHGIFDFVRRDAATYLPGVATTAVQQARVQGEVVQPAFASNLRRGAAFWDVIARGGVAARSITVPYAFPPPPDGARSLAGLGTPDVRGTNSSFTLLSTDVKRSAAPPPAGGQVALLEPVDAQHWRAAIDGPWLQVDGQRSRPTAMLQVGLAAEGLRVDAGGGQAVTLKQGATSEVLRLTFNPAPNLQIEALTRATVHSVQPPELYLEPLSISPQAPYLPLAVPPQYATALWQKIGPFKTVGWLDDTSALGAGAMDEAQFLREAQHNMQWTGEALLAALREHNDRLVVAVFTSPDRIAHMFFRALDAEHPAHDAAAATYAAAVDDSYVQMDKTIGEVQAELSPADTLLVMSDHGFTSFRRGFNINRWLVAHGYMKLRPGVRAARDFFADVDWAHTRAYAFGTGGIYLNLRGREGQGVVPPDRARALAQELGKGLRGTRDGSTVAVLDAYLGDALYEGPARADAPDVRVALAAGYRASWSTTLGGVPEALFEDNHKKWSGDHASARPEDVPGILLSSRPLQVAQPRIEDLAATAYQWAGIAPPATCMGRPLLHQEEPHAAR